MKGFSFSISTIFSLLICLPPTTSTTMNQVDQKGDTGSTFRDQLPDFTMGLKNMSSPIDRDVTFTCHVKNIGQYRVSRERGPSVFKTSLLIRSDGSKLIRRQSRPLGTRL